jgi:hemerythrin superfamily protein
MVIESGADVVTFLKSQHQQVKSMFVDVLTADGDQRSRAFYALRRMLAVHEAAEEEIIHPTARKSLVNGEEIVRLRLQEENEAKRALTDLEELDVDSETFESKLLMLQANVLAHAESEETQEFDALRAILEPKHMVSMRKAAEFIESMAPTRAHPGLESAAANIIVGPFVSMVDRARDAFSGRSAR